MRSTLFEKIGKTTTAFAAALVWLSATAMMAAAQTVVTGTGDPNVDVPAVQAALNVGGDVRLVGTFSFDRPPVNDRTVVISKAVSVTGAADEQGGRATILGGWRAFEVNAPGARVSIEGIRFVGPELFAIEGKGGVRGLRIANCKFEGVRPRNRPPNGFVAGAISIFPSNRALIMGDVTLLDNEIDVGGSATERTYGILVLSVGTASDPADVQIAGNRVANVTGHGIDLRQLAGRAAVERNEIRAGAVGGQQVALADVFVNGIRVLGTGSYLVRHNRVECGFENAAGIRLQGNSTAQPLTGATVESNEIVMTFPEGAVPGGQSAGIEIRRAASGNAVLHNRITGRARAAVSLVSDPTTPAGAFLTPASNTFVGNNLSNFLSTLADVFVGPRVTATTVVGGGGSVADLGADTLMKGGYRTLSGEHYQSQGGVGEVVADAQDEPGG